MRGEGRRKGTEATEFCFSSLLDLDCLGEFVALYLVSDFYFYFAVFRLYDLRFCQS